MAVQLNIARDRKTATEGTKEAKRKPEFYINVGYMDVIDGEEMFVSLPMGIILDDMRETEVKGKSEKYRELCRRKNRLLAMMSEGLHQLEAGEDDIIPELSVQARRAVIEDADQGQVHSAYTTLTKLTFGKRA